MWLGGYSIIDYMKYNNVKNSRRIEYFMWCSFFVIKNFVKNLQPLFNDILAGSHIYLYFTWIVTTTLTKIYTGDGDGYTYGSGNTRTL